MINFLQKKLEKSLAKFKAKVSLTQEDILEVSRSIKIALLEADVNLIVVKAFIKKIKELAAKAKLVEQINPSNQLIKIIHDELVQILGPEVKKFKWSEKLPIVMLVGLQGTGKTTTAAKLVNFLKQKNNVKKPLLIAADIYRPAAIDQLVTLGRQIQTDVYFEKKNSQPAQIIAKGLAKAEKDNCDLVVIDTAGRLSTNEKLMQELLLLKKKFSPSEILMVVDAIAGQEMLNVATEFHKQLNITGIIITKLDSVARGGAAFSIKQLLQIPIAFTSFGEKINTFSLFQPERMAKRILGMGDVLTLMEKAQDVIEPNKSSKIIQRIASGSFDLDDLMQQLKQVQKMGKFSKILELLPNSMNKVSSQQVHAIEQKMFFYKILISSMTLKERKNPKLLKQISRKTRIIKGSGRTNQEFNRLISDFERMKKQMSHFSKSFKKGSFNLPKLKNSF